MNVLHERSRAIREVDLGVFTFAEHIRKLTVKSICLFQHWIIQTSAFSLLMGGIPRVSFFWLLVSGIGLNITNLVAFMLLFHISLNFPSHRFKSWLHFAASSLLCLSMCPVFIYESSFLSHGLFKEQKRSTYCFFFCFLFFVLFFFFFFYFWGGGGMLLHWQNVRY